MSISQLVIIKTLGLQINTHAHTALINALMYGEFSECSQAPHSRQGFGALLKGTPAGSRRSTAISTHVILTGLWWSQWKLSTVDTVTLFTFGISMRSERSDQKWVALGLSVHSDRSSLPQPICRYTCTSLEQTDKTFTQKKRNVLMGYFADLTSTPKLFRIFFRQRFIMCTKYLLHKDSQNYAFS